MVQETNTTSTQKEKASDTVVYLRREEPKLKNVIKERHIYQVSD